MTRRVLMVDNHDSFVFTLVDYLRQLDAHVELVEADSITELSVLADWDGVIISPGPGAPRAAGRSVDIVREASRTRQPLLGVCLGHQAIAEAHGATVSQAPALMHGLTSTIRHTGAGLFAGLPPELTVGRYHSLAVEEATLPAEFTVTARTDDTVMAIAHRDLPIWGVQFHPESVLTQHGHLMLANWLALAGDEHALARARGLRPDVDYSPVQ